MVNLRWYQQEAHDRWWDFAKQRRERRGCVVLPTGSGKTPLLAEVCRTAVQQYRGRVLVVTHRKELIEQQRETLRRMLPDVEVGAYSAGLRCRDVDHDVICCGIQSTYKLAHDFGRRHLVIVDEAHLVGTDDATMYGKFLRDLESVNPGLLLLGLTATPYRTGEGKIYGRHGMFDSLVYEAPIAQLIEEGWLSRLTNRTGSVHADLSCVPIRSGDYVAGRLEAAMDVDTLVQPACDEIVRLAVDRRSVLVFTCGISHGKHVERALQERGQDAEFLCGDTPSLMRASMIERFRDGQLRWLVNCDVLTTGFDAPNVDCIAVLRPTQSPGLFAQIVGRGLRLCDGKADCLVLDYGDNIGRHGPLDSPSYGASRPKGEGAGEAPTKKCPGCEEEISASYAECPECGFLFPGRLPKHSSEADQSSNLLAKVEPPKWADVAQVTWACHRKRGWQEGDPRTLRVDYWLEGMGIADRPISEWVCLEHEGYARTKAIAWWAARCKFPAPATIEDAIEIFQRGGIAETLRINYGSDAENPRFSRVYQWELGYAPDEIPEPETAEFDLDDIAF